MQRGYAMNCRQTQNLLPDYLDNEAARASEIEAHLRGCDGCRAQLNGLQSTQQSVREALDSYPRSRIEDAAAFDARVLNAVLSHRNQQSPLDVFFDRCEAIFARPLWKLLASSVSGTLFGLMLVALIVPRDAAEAGDAKQSAPLSAAIQKPETNRFYALNGWRRDASSLEMLREMEAMDPSLLTPQKPLDAPRASKSSRAPRKPQRKEPQRKEPQRKEPQGKEPSWDVDLSAAPPRRSSFSSSPGPLC
jgi:hypothetical protein